MRPRLVLVVLILPIVIFGGFFGIVILASELAGEVVTVRSAAPDGGAKATRLWIVDDGGTLWLRAGVPSEAWLAHVDQTPTITLERGGTSTRIRAVPVRDSPAIRARIHGLMRARYGTVDAFISMLRDGERSVMVRLEPLHQ
jgi:hypothetical protein